MPSCSSASPARWALLMWTVTPACAPKAPAPTPEAPAYWSVSVELPAVSSARPVHLRDYWWAGPGPNAPEVVEMDDATFERLRPLATGVPAPDALDALLLDGLVGVAAVSVDAEAARVAGTVVPLDGGTFTAADRRGHLVAPLYDALVEFRQDALVRGEMLGINETDARVLVAFDARLPAQTLQDLVYAAGQAGLGRLDLVVQAPQAVPADAPALPPTARRVDLSVGAGGVRVGDTVVPIDQVPRHISAALDGQPGCGQVSVGPGVSAEPALTVLSNMLAAGVARPALALPFETTPATPAPVPLADSQAWSPKTALMAVPVELPTIGPPSGPDAPPCLPSGGVRF